jgi:hypothetical protein
LKGLGIKKPPHFLKKNGKVFEQLPPSQDHEVILTSITPSSLGRFGLKKPSSFFEKKWKGF